MEKTYLAVRCGMRAENFLIFSFQFTKTFSISTFPHFKVGVKQQILRHLTLEIPCALSSVAKRRICSGKLSLFALL